MNACQEGIITLIKSAINNRKYCLPEGFSLSEALETIEKHNIFTLAYYGAVNCGYDKATAEMQVLFARMCAQLSIDARQQAEFASVFDAFEVSGIDYMPLKGMILKALYPDTAMRAMGDADFLVKSSQAELAAKKLGELGYKYSHENDHESVWVKDVFVIDLHKALMSKKTKDFYAYFENIWESSRRIDDKHRCEMRAEEFYIFTFTHFAKHYISSGIGLKHITDLWILRSANALDFEYINAKLQKLKLLDFHANVIKTLDVWFGTAKSSEVTDFITKVIFESGEFGIKEKSKIGVLLREENEEASVDKLKRRKFLFVVFLSMGYMREKYKILQKFPVLLPVMWCVRFFDVIFNKKKTLKNFVRGRKSISKEKIEAYRDDLRFVGLKKE